MNFDLMNVLMGALGTRNWKKANWFQCFWDEEQLSNNIRVLPAWNMKYFALQVFCLAFTRTVYKSNARQVMKYRRFIEMGCTVILTLLYGSHIDKYTQISLIHAACQECKARITSGWIIKNYIYTKYLTTLLESVTLRKVLIITMIFLIP